MSNRITKEIKSGGKLLGTLDVEVFDTIDEAEDTLGEDECVKLINRGHAVKLMDNERRKLSGGGVKEYRDALRTLKEKAKDDPSVLEKLQAMAGE